MAGAGGATAAGSLLAELLVVSLVGGVDGINGAEATGGSMLVLGVEADSVLSGVELAAGGVERGTALTPDLGKLVFVVVRVVVFATFTGSAGALSVGAITGAASATLAGLSRVSVVVEVVVVETSAGAGVPDAAPPESAVFPTGSGTTTSLSFRL